MYLEFQTLALIVLSTYLAGYISAVVMLRPRSWR